VADTSPHTTTLTARIELKTMVSTRIAVPPPVDEKTWLRAGRADGVVAGGAAGRSRIRAASS
jgi:hypothetical protein